MQSLAVSSIMEDIIRIPKTLEVQPLNSKCSESAPSPDGAVAKENDGILIVS